MKKISVHTFSYIALLALFLPVFIPMWNDWGDNPDYSHGYLIIPVALYLAWEKRHLLKPIPHFSNIFPLIIFSISLLLFFIFCAGDIAFMARLFMVIVLASYLVIHLGYNNFSIFLFPILYLIFMIPLPGSIILPLTFPLRLFVSDLSTTIVQFIGIPIFRQGNILNLPNGILEVAPACSGMRSLVSLLSLSALMCYVMQHKIWKMALCFVAAVPVAIVTNILRVCSSILLFQYIGPSTAQGILHDSWGLVVFAISSLILASINMLVKKI